MRALSLAPTEAQRLFLLTVVIGGVCGLAAVLFHLAIRFVERLAIGQAMSAPGESWIPWTIVTPVLGGLVSGALLHYVVPGARGSGVPQVKAAYGLGGRVPFRDAVGKFAIGTIQIGTGASLGREGPTVQICAGIAGLVGRIASLSPKNLRRLLPVGVAAGIAAAFNAPISAVTFTIEEVVGDLDQTVLSGVVVAAALAAVVERSVLGEHPVFEVSRKYGLNHPSSILLYAALGVAAAVVSLGFTDSLLDLRRWFARHPFARWAHPAAGGLVTGLLAVVALALLKARGVTGGGYETLAEALSGTLGFRVMLALCAMKLVATVFCYSSGGAGGIFAPALFIGAMLGGAVGFLDVRLLGHGHEELGNFALVGMGAVFAGIVRAPITSVLIIFEMTGGYGLVLPLMIANMTSYGLARHWRPTPIYEALLEQDGIHLPHRRRSVTQSLEGVRAEAAMARPPPLLAGATYQEVLAAFSGGAHDAHPVVDERGALVGLLSLSDLRPVLGEDLHGLAVAGDLCRRPPPTIAEDEDLAAALERMAGGGVDELVVVSTTDPTRPLGVLTRAGLYEALRRSIA